MRTPSAAQLLPTGQRSSSADAPSPTVAALQHHLWLNGPASLRASAAPRQPQAATGLGLRSVTVAAWGMLWATTTLAWVLGYSLASALLLPHIAPWRRTFFRKAAFVPRMTGEFGGLEWCRASANMPAMWFSASRWVTAALCMLQAAWVAHRYGRKTSMACACVLYLLGKVLLASAFHIVQLVIGNLLVGAAISFLYESILLGNIETAPPRYRGGFLAFNMAGATIGFACGVMVFYAHSIRAAPNGWRIAVAVGAWPAIVVLVMLPWLPESPSYLIQCGQLAKGREALQQVRGRSHDCDEELNEIFRSAWSPATHDDSPPWAGSLWQQWRRIREPRHAIPVVLCACMGSLREVVGAHVVGPMSAPLLEHAFGETDTAASMWKGAAVLQAFYVLGTCAAVLVVDRVGRRPLLFSAACVLALAWGAVAGTISAFSSADVLRENHLTWLLMALAALILAANGWGWHSCWTVVTAECHQLVVRALAVALATSWTLLTRAALYVLTESVLCELQWRAMAFVAGVAVLMAVFVVLLPETSQVPLEAMERTWQQHWLWRRWCEPVPAAASAASCTWSSAARAPGSVSAAAATSNAPPASYTVDSGQAWGVLAGTSSLGLLAEPRVRAALGGDAGAAPRAAGAHQ